MRRVRRAPQRGSLRRLLCESRAPGVACLSVESEHSVLILWRETGREGPPLPTRFFTSRLGEDVERQRLRFTFEGVELGLRSRSA